MNSKEHLKPANYLTSCGNVKNWKYFGEIYVGTDWEVVKLSKRVICREGDLMHDVQYVCVSF